MDGFVGKVSEVIFVSFHLRNWRLVGVMVVALVAALVVLVLPFSSLGLAQEVGAGSSASKSPKLTGPEGKQYAAGQIIVKTKKDAALGDLRSINRRNDARLKEEIPKTDVSVVDLPKDLSVKDAVKLYDKSPNVAYAEPDYILYPTAVPNDPLYKNMDNLNNTAQTGGTPDADIDAPEAWNSTTGSASTIVGVIDTGVDINHPDLRNNIWTNPGESGTDSLGRNKATNGVDDDGNGYVDDVHGWDFVHNDNSVYDSGDGDDHGTHVAGTIAAQGNNGIGVTGVNWHAKIMPLKFITPGGGYASDAEAAIHYAIDNGAKITNNSWGGGGYSQSLKDAITAAQNAGVLFVAAAGNDGSNNDATPTYPASYDNANIISVAATTDRDALAYFSNHGSTSVDLGAPGVGILSTLPGKTYGRYGGTSMASPQVAGVASLIKSRHPEYGYGTIKAQILRYADKKASLRGKVATGGRLNAQASVTQRFSDTSAPTIANLRPSPGSKTRDRTPAIRATVADNRTDLTRGQISLYVDGSRRYFRYDPARNLLLFTPTLSYGRHVVRIVAHDTDYNYARRSWGFSVVR